MAGGYETQRRLHLGIGNWRIAEKGQEKLTIWKRKAEHDFLIKEAEEPKRLGS